ncbi:hypothetical protein BX616_007965, partial [Lobosporangium transversale]
MESQTPIQQRLIFVNYNETNMHSDLLASPSHRKSQQLSTSSQEAPLDLWKYRQQILDAQKKDSSMQGSSKQNSSEQHPPWLSSVLPSSQSSEQFPAPLPLAQYPLLPPPQTPYQLPPPLNLQPPAPQLQQQRPTPLNQLSPAPQLTQRLQTPLLPPPPQYPLLSAAQPPQQFRQQPIQSPQRFQSVGSKHGPAGRINKPVVLMPKPSTSKYEIHSFDVKEYILQMWKSHVANHQLFGGKHSFPKQGPFEEEHHLRRHTINRLLDWEKKVKLEPRANWGNKFKVVRQPFYPVEVVLVRAPTACQST